VRIAGLLLCAGASRRFGSDKLLARLPGGRTVAETALANLADVLGQVFVVARSEEGPLASVLAGRARLVACSEAHLGMGHSLACGVRAAFDAEGWIVALGDMPFLSPATIRSVADALAAGASIALPVHGDVRGHPVGFHRRHYAALSSLEGDVGAREIVRRSEGEVVLLETDDPGVLRDIDSPQDLSDP
jgi:molybdenum cofactor cytidylyltransferase